MRGPFTPMFLTVLFSIKVIVDTSLSSANVFSKPAGPIKRNGMVFKITVGQSSHIFVSSATPNDVTVVFPLCSSKLFLLVYLGLCTYLCSNLWFLLLHSKDLGCLKLPRPCRFFRQL